MYYLCAHVASGIDLAGFIVTERDVLFKLQSAMVVREVILLR